MWAQPGISNLLLIEALVTDTPLQTVISTWAGETRYGELKKKVAASVSQMFSEFQERLAKVFLLLGMGEDYANEVASAKLLEVQKVVHLR